MANTKITSNVIADGAITESKLASGVGGVAGIVSSADATAITIDSSERVGINTTSPARPLHTEGVGVLFANTGGTHEVLFGDNAYRYFGLYTPSSPDYMSIRTGSTDLLTVTSDGKVGIGTSSPSGELHILSTTQDTDLWVETTSAGGDARLNLYANSTGSSQIRFGDGDDANVGTLTYNHSENAMVFRVNDAERMRIDNSGMLVLQEGNGLHTDTLRNDSHTVTATASTILDFSTAGAVGGARGFYLVTVVREAGSVGSNGVYLVGVSSASLVILYDTIVSNSIIASTSGANFQVEVASGSITCHATAIPIGIVSNA